MTSSWRWNRTTFDVQLLKNSVELGDAILTLSRVDLQLVEVIEECPFALSLASKDKDVIVDDAAGVAVTTLWD